ncbi:MAG: hypothetical protein AAGL66_10675, partial [Pseudomonadota bacterium]
MNLFCVLSGQRVGESAAVKARIEARYGQEARLLGDPSWSAQAIVLDDRGALTGIASNEHGFLVYSGLLASYPETNPADLMDSPGRSAELLLTRFLDTGAQAFADLDGQFVVAAFDARTDRLLLLCDRQGQRRLFCADSNGAPYFATHLAAMSCVERQPTSMDRRVEDFLLGFEFLPDQRTPLTGVTHLGAGEALLFESGATVATSFAATQASPAEPIPALSDEKAVSQNWET